MKYDTYFPCAADPTSKRGCGLDVDMDVVLKYGCLSLCLELEPVPVVSPMSECNKYETH